MFKNTTKFFDAQDSGTRKFPFGVVKNFLTHSPKGFVCDHHQLTVQT